MKIDYKFVVIMVAIGSGYARQRRINLRCPSMASLDERTRFRSPGISEARRRMFGFKDTYFAG